VLLKPIRDDLLYGAEQSALDVARGLDKLGVKVDIAQWTPSPLPVKSERVGLLGVRFSGRSGLLKLTCSILHAIGETKADSVYAYADCFEVTMVPAFLASLLTHRKFVLCIPDDALKETDVLSLPQVFARWHASGHSIRSSFRFTFYHATRRLAVRTTAISLVSAGSVEGYARTVLRARKVYVIPLGLDQMWFGRTSTRMKYDAIYVGGLWGYKNVDVLISAWRQVIDFKADARLLILGEGGARPQLQNLAENLGISRSIDFIPYVPNASDVHDLLSESRIFAFASVWEGWGRAVTEAMATGLPCVLSDIPIFRELYSKTAVLVPPTDPKLFADAILGLLGDESKYDQLSREGQNLVRGFTWDSVARRMLTAIQEN